MSLPYTMGGAERKTVVCGPAAAPCCELRVAESGEKPWWCWLFISGRRYGRAGNHGGGGGGGSWVLFDQVCSKKKPQLWHRRQRTAGYPVTNAGIDRRFAPKFDAKGQSKQAVQAQNIRPVKPGNINPTRPPPPPQTQLTHRETET